MKYCFYSRKNGYEGGDPAKFFFTKVIDDVNDLTKDFVDNSGSFILKHLDTITDKDLREQLFQLATAYPNWYYYPQGIQITEGRIFI